MMERGETPSLKCQMAIRMGVTLLRCLRACVCVLSALSHPPLHSLHLPPLSSSSSLSSPFSRARERTSRMHAPAQTHTDTCGATMCAYPYELYTRIGAGVRRFQCYLRRQERRMPPRRFREQVLTGCGRDNEGCTL